MGGNNPKKNPPQFSRARDYERYRTALNAFMTVTDFDRKEVGMIIALSLPTDDEEGDIQGKCLEDIGDVLNTENSGRTVLNWLDKHFRKQSIELSRRSDCRKALVTSAVLICQPI